MVNLQQPLSNFLKSLKEDQNACIFSKRQDIQKKPNKQKFTLQLKSLEILENTKIHIELIESENKMNKIVSFF